MIRAAAALLSVLLVWASPAVAQRRAEVAVTRDGASWTADFRFTGRAGAWLTTAPISSPPAERPWIAIWPALV